jgi:hypothetical protein
MCNKYSKTLDVISGLLYSSSFSKDDSGIFIRHHEATPVAVAIQVFFGLPRLFRLLAMTE